MRKIIKFVCYLFLLSCVNFYSPQFLPFAIEEQIAKSITYSLYLLLFVLCVSNRGWHENNTYSFCFKMILWSMPFSVIMASTQHAPQSLGVSIIAVLPYFISYSSFFLLKKTKLSVSDLEKIMLIIGLVNIILTFQLWALLPNQLFGSIRSEEDGRGIRIGIDGDIFKTFFLFYSLYRYKTNKKKIWLLAVIICFITVFISLTRQVMLITIVLAVLYYMKGIKLYKKIVAIAVVFASLFVIAQLPYFRDLIEVSERQQEREANGNENIRITATRYYIDEAQVNALTRIFGNGCYSYGNSAYGREAYRQQYMTLCFPSDVGLVSIYYLFGVLAIIGMGLIIIKTVRIKIPERYEYMEYVIYYIMLASIASGSVLYLSQNIVLVVTCYLLGKVNYYGKEDRSNYIKLQQ